MAEKVVRFVFALSTTPIVRLYKSMSINSLYPLHMSTPMSGKAIIESIVLTQRYVTGKKNGREMTTVTESVKFIPTHQRDCGQLSETSYDPFEVFTRNTLMATSPSVNFL